MKKILISAGLLVLGASVAMASTSAQPQPIAPAKTAPQATLQTPVGKSLNNKVQGAKKDIKTAKKQTKAKSWFDSYDKKVSKKKSNDKMKSLQPTTQS